MAHRLIITLTDSEYQRLLREVEEGCNQCDAGVLISDWKEEVDPIIVEEVKNKLLYTTMVHDVCLEGGFDDLFEQ